MNSSKKKPIIGITCGEVYNATEPWYPHIHGQSYTYVESVIEAGGVPILLPLTRDKAVLEASCALVDGFLFAGGNDLHPNLYGQQPVVEGGDYSTLRDLTETVLLEWALAHHKPLLGICRGMQLLNVHCGGTLHQDIPTAFADSLDHDASSKLKSLVDVSHTLRLEPTSRLSTLLEAETLGANAHHHQAIDKLGSTIIATAWTTDGIIEAIELADYPYAIGIQAHPESLTKVESTWARLFRSLVDASS